MPFRVILLGRAEYDVNAIVDWLIERSPQGAARWLASFDDARTNLANNPLGYGLAPEDDFVDNAIRQIIFKTRRGRRYRALFTEIENEVRILHVRGPGQAPMKASEF